MDNLANLLFGFYSAKGHGERGIANGNSPKVRNASIVHLALALRGGKKHNPLPGFPQPLGKNV